MNWPDIFFRARPPRRQDKDQSPPAATVSAEAETPNFTPGLPSELLAPSQPVAPDQSVVQDMAEADTLQQLLRTGGVRLVKRDLGSPALTPEEPGASRPGHSVIPPPEAVPGPMPPAPPLAGVPSSPLASPDSEKKTTGRLAGSGRALPAINLSAPRDPSADTVYPAARTIFRRRTKIADVARVVLPPRREEAALPSDASAPPRPPAAAIPVAAEKSAIVIPPAFPVALPGRGVPPEPPTASAEVGSTSQIEDEPQAAPGDVPRSENQTFFSTSPAESQVPPNPVQERESSPPEIAPPSASNDNSPASAEASQIEVREKREFLLANGERILGQILSESPDAIYLSHDTLGVLTIPRAQIAQRLVEIILINGDRVVGDVIAESKDSLFVRHASLGILTVPRNQRSTRVVEAILKDGDRILGEVLSETDTFTVIRSATLGTVTVPHDKVAMLNRRAEEVQMKALPPPAAALGDKARI